MRTLIAEQRLDVVLGKRYPGTHDFATDKVLRQYTRDLRNQFLRNASLLDKVMYNSKTHVLKNALGLYTAVLHVQGGKPKAKAETHIAIVFHNVPKSFLRMIAVHELARLKEKKRSKAFCQLCCHMRPQYHQLESDARLWLTQQSLEQTAQSCTDLIFRACQINERIPSHSLKAFVIRFAVIGINWITCQSVDATHETGKYKSTAVYSRSLEQAQTFAGGYPVEHLLASLEAMAQGEAIDAVYMASPNSLHSPQTELSSRRKKHVTCRGPLASNLTQAEVTIACARENRVVLFEAFKTAYPPSFPLLRQSLPRVGKIGKMFTNYCQYSLHYRRYLDGGNPNTLNLTFSNGSAVSISSYCLASAVTLWGKPQSVQTSASLLESGVDTHGVVVLNYGDSSVMLQHSRVSDSVLASETQGESGSLIIEHVPER